MRFSKQQLRKSMRQKRQSLSKQQQQQAAVNLCRNIINSTLVQGRQRIAIYLANDGEICPKPLAKKLTRLGKQLYLPSLKGKALRFKRYTGQRGFSHNRFHILEPATKKALSAKQMDIIFMPLVAFDGNGNRLGMGGGFYDRTLAFKHKKWRKKPLLVGLAHQCQHYSQLYIEPWDVPVDAIATDQAFTWQ